MPFKNAEKYLAETLNSMVHQTEKKWELLAIDDHSSDRSLQIIQEFGTQDERIRVFKSQGQGIVAALSQAFDLCDGHLITRMDADDLMHEKKLERLKNSLMSVTEPSFSVCQVSYFSAEQLGDGYRKYETWINEQLAGSDLWKGIYKECVIPSCSWMLRKSDVLKFKLFEDLEVPEDYDLCFRLRQNDFKALPIYEKLHLWRDHALRTSRTHKAYDIRDFTLFKLKRFVSLEWSESVSLVVWGAGKKGKEMIRLLQAWDIPSYWITENEKKIGTRIYDQLLANKSSIQGLSQPKIILAVSNPEEQKSIEAYLKNEGFDEGKDYFLFF